MSALKQTYSAQQMVSANRRFHQETAEKKRNSTFATGNHKTERLKPPTNHKQVTNTQIYVPAFLDLWNRKKDCENQKTAGLRRNSTNPAVFA